MPERIDISLVIPVLNEEESVRPLHQAILSALQGADTSFEIVLVNDGSTDNSAGVLDDIASQDSATKVIHFRRNFGKAAALDAGFQSATGDIIITMDADLQDDPKEISRFIEKINQGFDVVSGWKKIRHDPIDKTFPSKIFNRLVSSVSGLKLHDFNCGFKAYRREVFADIPLYGELHRFIPVLAHWKGFRVAEIVVDHQPRHFGKSKFGTGRFIKGVFDLLTVILITRFQSRPLHFFGYIALVLGLIGSVGLTYLFILSINEIDPLRPRPLLYTSMLFIITAVQLIGIGLLGELVKSYSRRSAFPEYTIRSPSRMPIGKQMSAGKKSNAMQDQAESSDR